MTKPTHREHLKALGRGQNGHPKPMLLTLDLYHRLSVALIADPRYSGDEVVRLLREDELLVDTGSNRLSHKRTGEVVGAFEILEEVSEVEYVELDGQQAGSGAGA